VREWEGEREWKETRRFVSSACCVIRVTFHRRVNSALALPGMLAGRNKRISINLIVNETGNQYATYRQTDTIVMPQYLERFCLKYIDNRHHHRRRTDASSMLQKTLITSRYRKIHLESRRWREKRSCRGTAKKYDVFFYSFVNINREYPAILVVISRNTSYISTSHISRRLYLFNLFNKN